MINDAILVYVENNEVHHTFCTSAHAKAVLTAAGVKGEPASMFTSDLEFDQELIFKTSPNLRESVAAAKGKARRQLAMKIALDNEGFPADMEQRRPIYRAMRSLEEMVAL